MTSASHHTLTRLLSTTPGFLASHVILSDAPETIYNNTHLAVKEPNTQKHALESLHDQCQPPHTDQTSFHCSRQGRIQSLERGGAPFSKTVEDQKNLLKTS